MAIKKIIIVDDCMKCPNVGRCNAWKNLTAKQRFTLKVGVGIKKFILKDCKLQDYPDPYEDYERDENGYLLSPCCGEILNPDNMICPNPKCREHC